MLYFKINKTTFFRHEIDMTTVLSDNSIDRDKKEPYETLPSQSSFFCLFSNILLLRSEDSVSRIPKSGHDITVII